MITSSTLPSTAAPSVSEPSDGPRLAPIDRYVGIGVALLRAAFRFMFGKVMMPLRVVFPRIPGYAWPHFGIMWFATRGITLPRPVMHALSMRVSRNNACSFCFDMHKAAFMLEKPDPAALELATRDPNDPTLDPQLGAVLAYADEVVQQGNVSDATFARLTASFSEKHVVQIVWLAAFVTYTNMLARPLRLQSDGFCSIVDKKLS